MISLSQMPKTCFALSEFCLNFETLSFCDDVHVLKGSPSGRLILTMHANSSFFEVVDYDKFWDKDKDKDDKLTQVDLIAIVTMFAQPSEDRPEWPSKDRVTHEVDKEDKGRIEEDKGG